MRIIEMGYYAWRQLCAMVMQTLHPSPGPIAPPDRADLFQQLANLRARRAADTARYRQIFAALTRDLLPAQALVNTLQRALREAHADEFCKSMDGTAKEDTIIRALEGKTSTMLALFMEEIGHEIERLQRTEPATLIGMHREGRALKKQPSVQSDGPSLHRRLTALHHARQRAQSMVLEPLTVEETNREILRLRRALPPVELEIFGHEHAATLTSH